MDISLISKYGLAGKTIVEPPKLKLVVSVRFALLDWSPAFHL